MKLWQLSERTKPDFDNFLFSSAVFGDVLIIFRFGFIPWLSPASKVLRFISIMPTAEDDRPNFSAMTFLGVYKR